MREAARSATSGEIATHNTAVTFAYVAALAARDYPVIQAVVLIIGAAFCLITLAVDLSYVALDPRVRFR